MRQILQLLPSLRLTATLVTAVVCALFVGELQLPLAALLYLMAGFVAAGLWSLRITELTLLPRLMLVIYALPFTGLAGYLWDPDYIWWESQSAVALSSDPLVLQTMATLGLIGLGGLLVGLLPPTRAPISTATQAPDLFKPLSPFAFTLILATPVLLSWIAAPDESIWDTAYALTRPSWAQELNFNSAPLLAYSLITVLAIDAQSRFQSSGVRAFKVSGILVVTGIIVVAFQLSRGDRDCLGMIAALMAVYLTGRPLNRFQLRGPDGRVRLALVATVSLMILVVFISLGSLRFTLSSSGTVDLWQEAAEGLKYNTWTAVLLNNLGSAHQYLHGRFEYLWGLSYWEYLQSLPPGLVTQYLGYERPIDTQSGPLWWFLHVSSGGMHPLVVPFHNFGIFGVFVIMYLFGRIIAGVERRSHLPLWPRTVWAGFLCFSFMWFWYGEMNFIRGLMCIAVAGAVHRLAGARKVCVRETPVVRLTRPVELAGV